MPTLAGNVIRGTASYNAAAGTSPTAITLPRTINAAKSVVFYTQRGGETTQFRDHREFFGYELTNTTLQFLRTTATSAATMNLSYEVVEFADATSVQHIVQEITSTQTDIAISSVDMSRSVVFVLGARTDQDDIRGGTVRLESSTNVRVNCNTAPGAGDLILYLAVVQFDTDVSVQRGVVSLGSGNTTASGTVNIEEIDPARSVVIGGGQNDLNQYLKRMAVSWSIVDGETIAWNRAAYGSQVSKILPWQVITLANGFSRHGSYEITDGNTTPASQPSFTALDPTKSSLVVGFPLNECRPTVDITSTGMLGGANYRATIVPTVDFDGLTITRANARSGTSMAGTFAAFQWEGGEPTEETPPKDVAIINIGPGPSSVSGDVSASPGGSAVGTSLRYCITESDTPPSEESEDWIDLDWDDLPYPVTFKGSRGLWLHARTVGELDPSTVVTYPFTSPNLRVVGPVTNFPIPIDGFDTGEVDSTDLEPGPAGRIDWRADDNAVGEDVSIVVNAPSEDPPENISPPTVTGSFRVGGTAFAGPGEWTGNPSSYTYQWVIDDEDVEDATDASYEFQSGDLGLNGYCRVIAANGAGSSDPEVSATFGPILEAFDPGDLPEVEIDSTLMEPVYLGEQTTPTGTWNWYYLGAVSNGKAYLVQKADDDSWASIGIARYPGYVSGTTIAEQLYTVEYEGGESKDIRVLPGSFKFIDFGTFPVTPTTARVRAAIEAGRTIPADMAGFYWGTPPASWNIPNPGNMPSWRVYKPERIYGRQSTNNSIGDVSGSAGDPPSSRGLHSGGDIAMIGAALDDATSDFNSLCEMNYCAFMYCLSLPHLVLWSPNHHQHRDPFFPYSGDVTYSVDSGAGAWCVEKWGGGSWIAPNDYPFLSEIGATGGTQYAHGRNTEHLLNHGFAWWLATGDPRYPILAEAIAAYAFSAVYRGPISGKYRAKFDYQRFTINVCFNSTWALQDVGEHASGVMVWEPERINKIVNDLHDDYELLLNALDNNITSRPEISGITAPRRAMMTAWKSFDGVSGYSRFMQQRYGVESAYLWAMKGRPTFLRRICENAIIRAYHIGGVRGVWSAQSGSTILTMNGNQTTLNDIIEERFDPRTDYPTDSFSSTSENADIAQTVGLYKILLFAKDAITRGWMSSIDNLDNAISAMEACAANTSIWKYPELLAERKNGTVDFTTAGIELPE